MIRAKIGDIDITPFINEKSYKMDSVPVENKWTDANYAEHVDEVRRRVTGSFDLAFITDEQYNEFITLLNNNKSGNLLTITVYVGSDINNLQTIYAYYKMTYKKRNEAMQGYIVTIVNMSISER